MISESFTDTYGTRITTRVQSGSHHVQLLMYFKDNPEPFSYGFAPDDFKHFVKQVLRLAYVSGEED